MNTRTHLERLPSTNNAAYKARMRAYLANATEVDEKPEANEQERLNHLVKRFKAEHGWEVERVGKKKAALNWLQGLAIGIEYRDHAIPDEVLKLHGLEGRTVTERLSATLTNGWWEHLAANVVRLVDRYEKTGNA